MRTNILALSALFGLVGCTAALAQNGDTYSLPTVGYINVICPPGFTLIANQLITSTNNDPVIDINNTHGDYNGCRIYFWRNGSWAKYIANNNPDPPDTATNGWVEPNGPQSLLPGSGAAFFNALNTPLTFTFVGNVPEGSLTNTLNPGLNLVSSIVPFGGAGYGDLSGSGMMFPSLSGGQFDGDQVLLYFNSGNGGGGYTTFTADSLSYNPPGNNGWDGLPGQPDPVLNVGQAFWYRAGNGTVQWVENFFVNGRNVAAPSTAISSAKSATGSSVALRPMDAAAFPAISKNRRLQLKWKGQKGKSHVLQVSSDLKSWLPMQTNLWSSEKFVYTDPVQATNKMRFYRSFVLP